MHAGAFQTFLMKMETQYDVNLTSINEHREMPPVLFGKEQEPCLEKAHDFHETFERAFDMLYEVAGFLCIETKDQSNLEFVCHEYLRLRRLYMKHYFIIPKYKAIEHRMFETFAIYFTTNISATSYHDRNIVNPETTLGQLSDILKKNKWVQQDMQLVFMIFSDMVLGYANLEYRFDRKKLERIHRNLQAWTNFIRLYIIMIPFDDEREQAKQLLGCGMLFSHSMNHVAHHTGMECRCDIYEIGSRDLVSTYNSAKGADQDFWILALLTDIEENILTKFKASA